MVDQIRPPIHRKGSVARDQASLHLEVEVTRDGNTRCEGVWGTVDAT